MLKKPSNEGVWLNHVEVATANALLEFNVQLTVGKMSHSAAAESDSKALRDRFGKGRVTRSGYNGETAFFAHATTRGQAS